jgi:hypothetical protein
VAVWPEPAHQPRTEAGAVRMGVRHPMPVVVIMTMVMPMAPIGSVVVANVCAALVPVQGFPRLLLGPSDAFCPVDRRILCGPMLSILRQFS